MGDGAPAFPSGRARAFLKAARTGDVTKVRNELHALLDLPWKDFRSKRGRTALQLAASKGHVEVARLLIAEGANVEARNKWGETSFLVACRRGHVSVAELLISKQCDQNAKNNFENGALALASANGKTKMTETLVEMGFGVNETHQTGCTPLHLAAQNGHVEVAECLLEKGANLEAQDKMGQTPFLVACSYDQLDVAKFFIGKGCNHCVKNSYNNGALALAIMNGKTEMTKELVSEFRLDINEDHENGFTSLHCAAQEENITIAQYLVERGANDEAKDNFERTPFLVAVLKGNKKLTDLLLPCHPNAEDPACDAILHLIAQKDFNEMTALLISMGANLESKDEWGCTAFLTAVEFGCDNVIDLLVQEGCNIHATTDSGECALDMAIFGGRFDLFERFIDAGIRVNKITEETQSFIRRMADEKIKEAIKFFEKIKENSAGISSKEKEKVATNAARITENEATENAAEMKMIEDLKDATEHNINLFTDAVRMIEDLITERDANEKLLDQMKRALRNATLAGEEKDAKIKKLKEYDELLKIPIEGVQLTDVQLGKGPFAEVLMGRWCGSSVAVKTLHTMLEGDHYRTIFHREMEISKRLSHHNVVSIYGVMAVDNQPLRIITPLREGSLRDVITAAPLTLKEKIDLSIGFVAGVCYLHQLPTPVVHGNIRAKSILVTTTMEAEVGDLVSARFAGASAGLHSPECIAPEWITSHENTDKADIYSSGVTLVELMTYKKPNRKERRTQVGMIQHEEIRNLCLQMINDMPTERPKALACLEVLQVICSTPEYTECPRKRLVRGKAHGHGQVTLEELH
ncbi:ankyrin-3-like isoform X2 [Oscarella lobularis]|uniref:ankyrin-3-like isoform X2 n=1 Tax=Oscarella lobularis TaxID=121494 RepID=UPI0033141405